MKKYIQFIKESKLPERWVFQNMSGKNKEIGKCYKSKNHDDVYYFYLGNFKKLMKDDIFLVICYDFIEIQEYTLYYSEKNLLPINLTIEEFLKGNGNIINKVIECLDDSKIVISGMRQLMKNMLDRLLSDEEIKELINASDLGLFYNESVRPIKNIKIINSEPNPNKINGYYADELLDIFNRFKDIEFDDVMIFHDKMHEDVNMRIQQGKIVYFFILRKSLLKIYHFSSEIHHHKNRVDDVNCEFDDLTKDKEKLIEIIGNVVDEIEELKNAEDLGLLYQESVDSIDENHPLTKIYRQVQKIFYTETNNILFRLYEDNQELCIKTNRRILGKDLKYFDNLEKNKIIKTKDITIRSMIFLLVDNKEFQEWFIEKSDEIKSGISVEKLLNDYFETKNAEDLGLFYNESVTEIDKAFGKDIKDIKLSEKLEFVAYFDRLRDKIKNIIDNDLIGINAPVSYRGNVMTEIFYSYVDLNFMIGKNVFHFRILKHYHGGYVLCIYDYINNKIDYDKFYRFESLIKDENKLEEIINARLEDIKEYANAEDLGLFYNEKLTHIKEYDDFDYIPEDLTEYYYNEMNKLKEEYPKLNVVVKKIKSPLQTGIFYVMILFKLERRRLIFSFKQRDDENILDMNVAKHLEISMKKFDTYADEYDSFIFNPKEDMEEIKQYIRDKVKLWKETEDAENLGLMYKE